MEVGEIRELGGVEKVPALVLTASSSAGVSNKTRVGRIKLNINLKFESFV